MSRITVGCLFCMRGKGMVGWTSRVCDDIMCPGLVFSVNLGCTFPVEFSCILCFSGCVLLSGGCCCVGCLFMRPGLVFSVNLGCTFPVEFNCMLCCSGFALLTE